MEGPRGIRGPAGAPGGIQGKFFSSSNESSNQV